MPAVTINGERATDVVATVPWRGSWFADVTLEDESDLSGRITIQSNGLEMVGTIDDRYSGKFRTEHKLRVVGGGGGWTQLVPSKGYHNDAGVAAVRVAQDVASEVGESLGTFTANPEKVGVDFARQAGTAGQVLDQLVGSTYWWVDYAGLTQAGAREVQTIDLEQVQLLSFDQGTKKVMLAADDLTAVQVGYQLDIDDQGTFLIRELTLSATDEGVTFTGWCGPGTQRSRLAGVLSDMVEAVAAKRLFGMWRYRVSRQSGDRLELQAINPDAGLPDLLPISMWPGTSGSHAEPALGSEVLVQFVEGNRAQPIVTHFAGKDKEGFVPVSLLLAADAIKIGSDAASEAMVLGNELKSWILAHTHPTGVGPSGVPVEQGTFDAALSTKTVVE